MKYKVIKSVDDLVFIPKGVPYFEQGALTLLSFNVPRFDEKLVDYLN